MSLLVLNEDELRQIITIHEAVDAVQSAFSAQARGHLNPPAGFTIDLYNVQGRVDVTGTYLDDAPYYVVKVDNTFAANPSINLPTHSGLMVIFDAATGYPAAVLVDNGYVSNLRAAAVGALAARYLANEHLAQVAVLGTGTQAYLQMKALFNVRELESVVVWSPSLAQADSYARRIIEDHDVDIQLAESVEQAVQAADLIIVASSSQHPLIQGEWLKPGVHINVVSSGEFSRQELHGSVMTRADVIVTDKLSRATQIGEIHHGLEAGVITTNDLHGELGDLVVGKLPGRINETQITIADLTGLGIQDSVIATLILDKAIYTGVGQRVVSPL